jgi:hypothetical protein
MPKAKRMTASKSLRDMFALTAIELKARRRDQFGRAQRIDRIATKLLIRSGFVTVDPDLALIRAAHEDYQLRDLHRSYGAVAS